VSAACFAAAALTASANASAHYYGILVSNDIPIEADWGNSVVIETFEFGSSCSNFVNHEMWYGVVPGATYWVEVGFKDGLTGSGGCVADADFWADYRNGGGYNEHYPGNSWILGDWYQLMITIDTSNHCNWNVEVGGLVLGTSTSNCPGTGRYVAAGIEATTQGTSESTKGFLTQWEEENTNGTWLNGWDGASLSENSPPYIEFVSGTNNTTLEEVLNEPF